MGPVDALLARGPRRGPAGLLVGAYAVVWGLTRIAGDKKLRSLALVPLVLTAVLYLLAIIGLVVFGDDVLNLLWAQPDGGGMLVLWWISAILVIGVSLLVLVLLFSVIAEAVGGPFYDKMAVRVLHAHGIETHEPGMIEGTVPDIFRSLLFIPPTVVFGLLGLIPVVGIVFVVLGTGVAWLGLASGAVNPALLVTENNLRSRLGWLREHFFTALGIGGVVAAALLMPFLGLVAIPASIVGASELHARARRRSDGAPAAAEG
jgi:CysZ protein